MSRAGVAALALAACVATAGCTSAAHTGSTAATVTSTPAPADTAATTAPALPTLSVPASASSSAPTSPRPATTSPAATTHAVAAIPTCLLPAMNIRVLQGGAVPGSEIAVIIATNTGTATCSLTGFPSVSLRLNGRQIGQQSAPSGATVSTVTLKTGEQATSQITDHSSCQAALSDTARISLPGVAGGAVDEPAQMRGCALTVAPMTAG